MSGNDVWRPGLPSNTDPAPWPPKRKINPAVPHPVRMYDYMLGGKDNFEADRKAAEELMAISPAARAGVQDNRDFLSRAVRHLSELGVTQFLDIGAGLPSHGNVHEIAQAVHPTARVVYVDNDPMVMAHARALRTSTSPEGKVAHVETDVRDPEAILSHPGLRATLDFDRPIALLLLAMLSFVQDADEPHKLVRHLLDALPSGSYLVLSHLCSDLIPPPAVQAITDVYAKTSAPITIRSRTEILQFFDGTELIEPGLVKVFLWHPEEHEHRGPDDITGLYAGVGRKP